MPAPGTRILCCCLNSKLFKHTAPADWERAHSRRRRLFHRRRRNWTNYSAPPPAWLEARDPAGRRNWSSAALAPRVCARSLWRAAAFRHTARPFGESVRIAGSAARGAVERKCLCKASGASLGARGGAIKNKPPPPPTLAAAKGNEKQMEAANTCCCCRRGARRPCRGGGAKCAAQTEQSAKCVFVCVCVYN